MSSASEPDVADGTGEEYPAVNKPTSSVKRAARTRRGAASTAKRLARKTSLSLSACLLCAWFCQDHLWGLESLVLLVSQVCSYLHTGAPFSTNTRVIRMLANYSNSSIVVCIKKKRAANFRTLQLFKFSYNIVLP